MTKKFPNMAKRAQSFKCKEELGFNSNHEADNECDSEENNISSILNSDCKRSKSNQTTNFTQFSKKRSKYDRSSCSEEKCSYAMTNIGEMNIIKNEGDFSSTQEKECLSQENFSFSLRYKRILLKWLKNHAEFSYPTEEEIIYLTNKTGMTRNKLINLLIYARKNEQLHNDRKSGTMERYTYINLDEYLK